MFCVNCGSKLMDGVKFCPNCGTKVNGIENPVRQVQATAPGGLPAGMTRSPDGRIWWSFRDKKDEYLCYMGEDTYAAMLAVVEKKPSALGMFILDVAAAHSDDYPYPELPSELLDPDAEAPRVTVNGREYYHSPLKFRYVTAMKEDRKRGAIRLWGTGGWCTLRFTPEQYGFALEYLLAHCPNIRKRT